MSALSEIKLGTYTLRGASLGGLYTAFHIPELDSLFDVGLAIRSGATASHLFLSHAHLDHLGALPSLLGMRGMVSSSDKPLKLYCPKGLEDRLQKILVEFSALHHWPLNLKFNPMVHGDELKLRQDLWVKALQTFHPVPSLGYLLFNRVSKLRPQYQGLKGHEIKALKDAGEQISHLVDRPKLAYLTDTLPEALKHNPEALKAEILIIECTFLNDRKGIETARAGCHIHIEELIPWAEKMENKHVVLMHFSQVHRPSEIVSICEQRLKPILGERLKLCLPHHQKDHWWI